MQGPDVRGDEEELEGEDPDDEQGGSGGDGAFQFVDETHAPQAAAEGVSPQGGEGRTADGGRTARRLRYGASRAGARAAERGPAALALTDRDGPGGAIRFAEACEEQGVRPPFGAGPAPEPPTAPDGPGASCRARRRPEPPPHQAEVTARRFLPTRNFPVGNTRA
ncbi:hypothetical protein GCM10010282_61130 [Streptomyces roseolus]|nr:hypothetical protein GCM10010282_61130 [Streptomyces roseolus]